MYDFFCMQIWWQRNFVNVKYGNSVSIGLNRCLSSLALILIIIMCVVADNMVPKGTKKGIVFFYNG